MDCDNCKTTTPSPSRDYYDDEIDLRDLILVMWRYHKLIVGIFLAFLLIGTVISFAITPIYQVKAKISMGNYAVEQDSAEQQMTPEIAREVMLSSNFQEQAWGPEANAGELSVSSVENTNILDITLNTDHPQQGKALLSKLIAEFNEGTEERYERSIELVNDELQRTEGELQEINKSIEQTRELLEDSNASPINRAGLLDTLSRFLDQRDKLLDKKLKAEQKLNSIEDMEVLEKPEASSAPVSPNKKLYIVAAAMLGLIVSVCVAFAANYFRQNPLNVKHLE